MARAFASNKNAQGICDRCGFTYPLKELRKERTNLNETNMMVCPECWDPDHPQNQLGRQTYEDPQALRNPRIDTGEKPGNEGTSIRFEFTDGVESFQAVGGDIAHQLLDGTIKISEFGFGSSATIRRAVALGNPVSIDASIYTRIVARVGDGDPGGSGIFTWAGGGSGSIVSPGNPFAHPTMGDQWRTVVWELDNEATWTGTTTDITFDMFSAEGSVVEVDYIRFEKRFG